MLLLKIAIPMVTGVFSATLVTYGLVNNQTAAPETNPASTPVLTYGDQS